MDASPLWFLEESEFRLMSVSSPAGVRNGTGPVERHVRFVEPDRPLLPSSGNPSGAAGFSGRLGPAQHLPAAMTDAYRKKIAAFRSSRHGVPSRRDQCRFFLVAFFLFLLGLGIVDMGIDAVKTQEAADPTQCSAFPGSLHVVIIGPSEEVPMAGLDDGQPMYDGFGGDGIEEGDDAPQHHFAGGVKEQQPHSEPPTPTLDVDAVSDIMSHDCVGRVTIIGPNSHDGRGEAIANTFLPKEVGETLRGLRQKENIHRVSVVKTSPVELRLISAHAYRDAAAAVIGDATSRARGSRVARKVTFLRRCFQALIQDAQDAPGSGRFEYTAIVHYSVLGSLSTPTATSGKGKRYQQFIHSSTEEGETKLVPAFGPWTSAMVKTAKASPAAWFVTSASVKTLNKAAIELVSAKEPTSAPSAKNCDGCFIYRAAGFAVNEAAAGDLRAVPLLAGYSWTRNTDESSDVAFLPPREALGGSAQAAAGDALIFPSSDAFMVRSTLLSRLPLEWFAPKPIASANNHSSNEAEDNPFSLDALQPSTALLDDVEFKESLQQFLLDITFLSNVHDLLDPPKPPVGAAAGETPVIRALDTCTSSQGKDKLASIVKSISSPIKAMEEWATGSTQYGMGGYDAQRLLVAGKVSLPKDIRAQAREATDFVFGERRAEDDADAVPKRSSLDCKALAERLTALSRNISVKFDAFLRQPIPFHQDDFLWSLVGWVQRNRHLLAKASPMVKRPTTSAQSHRDYSSAVVVEASAIHMPDRRFSVASRKMRPLKSIGLLQGTYRWYLQREGERGNHKGSSSSAYLHWSGPCCHCCGFSNEVAAFMGALDTAAGDVGVVAGDSAIRSKLAARHQLTSVSTNMGMECHCPGLPLSTAHAVERKNPTSGLSNFQKMFFAPAIISVEDVGFGADQLKSRLGGNTKEDWQRLRTTEAVLIHVLHGNPVDAGSYDRLPIDYAPGILPEAVVYRFMYEFDTIPKAWAEMLNLKATAIWVPSHAVMSAAVSGGVDPSIIKIVPDPVDTDFYNPNTPLSPLGLPPVSPPHEDGIAVLHRGLIKGGEEALNVLKEDQAASTARYTFLSTFKWEARKGWRALVKAYTKAFSVTDNVVLYIHTSSRLNFSPPSPGDCFTPPSYSQHDKRFNADEYRYHCLGPQQPAHGATKVLQLIERVLLDTVAVHGKDDRSQWPMIVVLTEVLSEVDMVRLLKAADVFVLPTHGEGFGLPIAQAMSMGKVVVTTEGSGMADYTVHEHNALLVPSSWDELKYPRLYGYQPADDQQPVANDDSVIALRRSIHTPLRWLVLSPQVLASAMLASRTMTAQDRHRMGQAAREAVERHCSFRVVAAKVKAETSNVVEEIVQRRAAEATAEAYTTRWKEETLNRLGL